MAEVCSIGAHLRDSMKLSSKVLRSGHSETQIKLGVTAARGLINLRMGPQSAAAETVNATLGLGLPSEACKFVAFDRGIVIPLGPDEWLVETELAVEHMVAMLRGVLEGQHVSITVVTDSYAVFELGGYRACDVLRKGCGIDLHPKVFSRGHCAQTRLARAHILLLQIDDLPTYQIYVDRSMADYLWAWISDAMLEFGLVDGEA